MKMVLNAKSVNMIFTVNIFFVCYLSSEVLSANQHTKPMHRSKVYNCILLYLGEMKKKL